MGEQEINAPFSTLLKGKEPFDVSVERFFASLRFEHRGKLDQLGIEIDTMD
jgi:hypothetical protein